jgi:hypothetical protein
MGWALQAKCLLQSSVSELLHCAVVLQFDIAEQIPLISVENQSCQWCYRRSHAWLYLIHYYLYSIINSPSQHLAVTSSDGFLVNNPVSDISEK